MARKKKSDGNFTHYLIMGAGFAAGAAVVSVMITGVTIAANEVYKMATGKGTNALGAGPAAGGELPPTY